MAFLNWLLGRAPTAETPPPAIIIRDLDRVRPPLPADDTDDDNDDFPELSLEVRHQAHIQGPASKPDAGQPLENLYCEIEYRSSSGEVTRRPITMLTFKQKANCGYIFAICHLRRAQRTFRCDRVLNVVTSDGEVIEGQVFFREIMFLDVPRAEEAPLTLAVSVSASPRLAPAKQVRDAIIAPLSVLAACAKVDGQYHEREIDRIISYAETEAIHLKEAGIISCDLTIEMADNLVQIVKSLRPQKRTIERHLATVLSMEPAALERFIRALRAVVVADGRITEEEEAFLIEFESLASDAAARAHQIGELNPPSLSGDMHV